MTKLICALLALLSITATAAAVDLEFHEAPPVVRRPPAAMPPALADVYSRLFDAERHRDPIDPADLVTWTHEGTHGVSALTKHPRGSHSIYLLDGRAITLRHPAVTIQQVAAAAGLPDGREKEMHRTYLVQQTAYWNAEPVYLLEEWTGYVHGAIVREQVGDGCRADTVWRADVMERWCRIMAKVARERDPGAPDLDRIDAFIEWNAARMLPCRSPAP